MSLLVKSFIDSGNGLAWTETKDGEVREPEQLARTSGTPIKSDHSRIAARLNRLRTERGWTLAELSRLTKLSKPYLSRLESGQRQPSLAALLALARTYEAP